MKKMLVLVLVPFFMMNSCASIIKGSGPQAIRLKSIPQGANCNVYDLKTNDHLSNVTTPAVVPLNKSRGYFKSAKYSIHCEQEGKESQEALIEGSVNGWYLGGNILLGGLIGWLIIDPATGAMWSLDPEVVIIDFEDPSKSIPKKGVDSNDDKE